MGNPSGHAVRFEILGPLQAWRDDFELHLGSVQQRVVLAVLLLHANKSVGRQQLIDAVWGEATPRYAVNLLQRHVSGLRRALEPERAAHASSDLLRWTDVGYSIQLVGHDLDLDAFDREIRRARAARAADDLPSAEEALSAALRLWRGPAFDGLTSPLLETQRDVLAERRIRAVEERIEINLALGNHDNVIAELRELVAEHPMRERLQGQLMLALYRSDRQADALAAFQEARRRLRHELGVEPGSALTHLHNQILQATPDLSLPRNRESAPAATVPVAEEHTTTHAKPAQLPHDIPDFIGRVEEIDHLDGLLPKDAQDPGATMAIAVIAGTAGVGKTALALHWSHRIKDRFSDGQLYVNLRGFDPSGQAMSPGEAIREFLYALAVRPQEIPTSLDAQTALFRSLLAAKRVLVVLDNARDADQVRPLLPGSSGCLVVVTSRNQLPGLVAAQGAQPVPLDLLSPADARRLLERRLGAARVNAERDAVEDIIDSCARLPLTLTIVAARAAIHRKFPLNVLAGQLRDAVTGLDAFDDGDATTDVRRLFSWSYRTLGPEAARMYRLLGLHPGPDIGIAAAASLAAAPVHRARRQLAELARAHLVTESAPERFAFHDLLRAYAAEQAVAIDAESERRAATHRMFDHYLHTGYAASLQLDPYRYPVPPPPAEPGVAAKVFAQPSLALDWYRTEHTVLFTTIRQAAHLGFNTHAWQMAILLQTYCDREGYWTELATTMRVAHDIATRLADPNALANTHRGVARAYARLGRDADARTHLLAALDVFRTASDLAGQAGTHLALAELHQRQDRYELALHESREALELYRANGNRQGQARALSAAAWHHAHLGDCQQALMCCRTALTLHEMIDDRSGAAGTFDSLGYVHHRLGDHGQAIDFYQRAIDLRRSLSDRYNEASTLTRLGDAHFARGDIDAADKAWRDALTILEQLHHPDAEIIRAKTAGLDDNGPP